jgi:hypothetical protein
MIVGEEAAMKTFIKATNFIKAAFQMKMFFEKHPDALPQKKAKYINKFNLAMIQFRKHKK